MTGLVEVMVNNAWNNNCKMRGLKYIYIHIMVYITVHNKVASKNYQHMKFTKSFVTFASTKEIHL